jgi:hypothetical protein
VEGKEKPPHYDLKAATTYIYIYMHIYINNILYIISTPTYFNATASSSARDDPVALEHVVTVYCGYLIIL